MSRFYGGFRHQMSDDLAQASMAAKTFGDKVQRVRITASDMAAVPVGSLAEVEPTSFQRLQWGDVILVRIGRDVRARRFLRVDAADPRFTEVIVTAEKGWPQERPGISAVVGRIVSVEFQGRVSRPGRENVFQRMAAGLTDYGSVSVGEKLKETFHLLKVLLRKQR